MAEYRFVELETHLATPSKELGPKEPEDHHKPNRSTCRNDVEEERQCGDGKARNDQGSEEAHTRNDTGEHLSRKAGVCLWLMRYSI